MSIQDEVRSALIEAGLDVSGAPLMVGFLSVVDDKPWADGVDPTPVLIPCMDSGIKKMLVEGTSEEVAMRRLLVPTDLVYQPKVGDKVFLQSDDYVIHKIEPVAPFGPPLMHKVYIAI